MRNPRRILFLCTGNCIRSQMAEGLLRHLGGNRYESLSAGAYPAGFVHDFAVEVLGEIGIDITGHHSKGVERFLPPWGAVPDVLVSLCDYAARACPAFPASVSRLHWPFYDPIEAMGTTEERLGVFRRVRDEIRARIERAVAAGELDEER